MLCNNNVCLARFQRYYHTYSARDLETFSYDKTDEITSHNALFD